MKAEITGVNGTQCQLNGPKPDRAAQAPWWLRAEVRQLGCERQSRLRNASGL